MSTGVIWSDDLVQGGRVLNDLQSVDEFGGESGEEGIAVVRRDGSGRFRGDVDLCVVGVAMKMDPMVTEECAEGEEVNGEKKGTQD